MRCLDIEQHSKARHKILQPSKCRDPGFFFSILSSLIMQKKPLDRSQLSGLQAPNTLPRRFHLRPEVSSPLQRSFTGAPEEQWCSSALILGRLRRV